MSDSVIISSVSHSYGPRQALVSLSLRVGESQIFGLLGPNGSGKSTLFKVLSTLIPLQKGDVQVAGHDLRESLAAVRGSLGVVFQNPSLDKKLTVRENLLHQGHLYGLHGVELENRSRLLLQRLQLADRGGDLVQDLSGGLQRRVEVAKGLLHRPRVLLLDEPSTGLDPGARRELWNYLREIRGEDGVTILVTTHLMEEAECCDRLALIDQGHLIAEDTPAGLKSRLSGRIITIQSPEPEALRTDIRNRFGIEAAMTGSGLRIECGGAGSTDSPATLLGKITDACGPQIDAITLAQANLEDVFIHLTGRRFDEEKLAA